VGGNGVASIISGAIQLLLRYEVASGELENMVEAIIESLLHYGTESEPAGPFASRFNAMASSHSTVDGTVIYAPHPFFHSSRAHSFPDVARLYTHAFRAGKFAPRVLDIVTSSTYWSTVFLEDPDVESSGRTIGEEIFAWVAAIVADGVPTGVVDNSKAMEQPSGNKDGDVEDDEDDDELIDVVEEDSEEDTDERGRGRGRLPAIFPEDDDDEEEDLDVHFALDANGYPTALLTKALQRLRRDQKISAQQRGSPTIHSPLSPGTKSPSPLGLSDVLTRPPGIGNQNMADVSLDPIYITAYFRRGSQYSPSTLAVPRLSALLDLSAASDDATRPSTWLKPDIRQPFPKNWQGPVQLQPQELRFSIFCYAFVSNTPNIRGLPNDWVSVCVATRWAIVKMGEKPGGGSGKWKRSDAKALLVACILEKQNAGDDYFVTSASASIISSSYLSLRSAPSIMANSQQLPTDSPTAPLPAQHPEEAPLDATPRAIQLTAQYLVAAEMIQHLSSVLLLADRVHPMQAGRLFSGRRFHGLLARIHSEGPPDEEGEFIKTHLLTEEGREMFEMLWNAVEDGIKPEWWGEEWVSSALTKKERKRAKKRAETPVVRTPSSAIRGKAPQPKSGGMFSALALVD
jgi:hypothetical protein